MNTQTWIEPIGSMLLHFLWQATLVAALLWIFNRFASRARPQVRYVAACVALLSATLMAAGTVVSYLHTEPPRVFAPVPTPPPQAVELAPSNLISSPQSDASIVISNHVVLETPNARPASSFYETARSTLAKLMLVIVAVWLLGVAVCSFRLLGNWRTVQQLRRSGDTMVDHDWRPSIAILSAKLRVAKTVRFLTSSRVRVPMVLGWLRPVILFPGCLLTGLSFQQIEAIIAHELAHVRRHDYLVNLLQNIVETIFFYHPLVWWISARIRIEREHCCDDIAARVSGDAIEYVRALSALEELCATRFAIAANGGSLVARVRRLLTNAPAEGPTTGLVAGSVVFLAILAAFALPLTLLNAADPDASKRQEASTESKASHVFDRVRRAEIWPAEALDKLPFGPKNSAGLRAAWIFRPMRDNYALGDALVSRIIIHNAGTEPIELLTDAWHQDDKWLVTNAQNIPITVEKISMIRTGDPDLRARLAPGDTLEVPAHGLGVGRGEFDAVYGDDRVGVKLPAKAGDEFRCRWEINVRAASTLGSLVGTPVPAKLQTGEVKFRVTTRDPNAPKAVGVATGSGVYRISPTVTLRIDDIRFRAGLDGLVTKSNGGTLRVKDAPPGAKEPRFKLPNGEDSYVIAFERGGTALWIGEAECIRKLDLSVAGRFPLNEILESAELPQREELLKLAPLSDGGVPEQRWKWEDSGDFGGIPTTVKAALLERRPKPQETEVAPQPASAVEDVDSKRPWRASGKVTDGNGRPMPGVEIWVHAGSGSLKRTALAKTDANGRYTVNFGPGVLMERDSSQLQAANITAHRPGFFEKNLNRHGEGAAAMRNVPTDELESYRITAKQLTLPDRPREVNFVMLPAGTIKGQLVGTGSFPAKTPQDYRDRGGEKNGSGTVQRKRAQLANWKLWLTGPKLPPACSVLASAQTDDQGNFEFRDVPTGFDWQIQADTHHHGFDPRTALFKVGDAGTLSTTVELNGDQRALKFVVGPRRMASYPGPKTWTVQIVEGETGRPLRGVPVKAVQSDADPAPKPVSTYTTNADGLIHLNLLPRKIVILEVNASDRWAPGGLWVGETGQPGAVALEGIDPTNPKVIAVWKGTRVTGRLLEPNGNPVADAPLNVGVYVDQPEWKKRLGENFREGPNESGETQNWVVLIKTGADGSFATTVPPPAARNWIRVSTPALGFGIAALPATRKVLENSAPLEAEIRSRDVPGAERDGVANFGELRMHRGVVLKGRVEDSDGRPLAGMGLLASRKYGSLANRTAATTTDGTFAFPPMAPGKLELHADPRLAVNGAILSREIAAIFVSQAVTLPEGAETMEVVVRAVPSVTVRLEWIDRRKNKGPINMFGTLGVFGLVPRSNADSVPWRGDFEKAARDGKEFIDIKFPKDIIDPKITLSADPIVTLSYEDDQTKLGPGVHVLPDFATSKRRVIYADDPK